MYITTLNHFFSINPFNFNQNVLETSILRRSRTTRHHRKLLQFQRPRIAFRVLVFRPVQFYYQFRTRFPYWSDWRATFLTVLTYIISLALLLPGLGLSVRRLHDINRSGWWVLIGLIPLVGAIILIIWFAKESDPVENQYGPVPNTVG